MRPVGINHVYEGAVQLTMNLAKYYLVDLQCGYKSRYSTIRVKHDYEGNYVNHIVLHTIFLG